MESALNRQIGSGIALLVLLFWTGAAAGLDPTGEETTPPATERHYRGSEEEGMPLFQQAAREYEAHNYAEAARLLEQAYAAHEHPLLAYNLGQAHRNAENYEAALTAYRNYIQLCPRDELVNRVYVLIGECLLQLDRRQEANEAFQHYLDLEHDGEYAAQAQRALESGETPSAQDRRDPQAVEQAREICDRAAALWEQEQFQQAAEVFLRGYERMPEMHEFLYDAGLCYLDAQAWNDASRTLRRYVETPGAAHDAWAFLGECYGEMFDFGEAVEAYERYLELEPRGEYAQEARDFVNDTMPFPSETGVRRETGATPGEFERAEVHFNAGREHFDAGRFQEAIGAFESAFEIVPSRALVYNIGLCLSRLGQWQEALTRFEQFLERDDQGMAVIAHLEAAECLIELRRPQDAVRHLDQFATRAQESDLDNEETHTARAEQLRRRAQGGGASTE
ncbi:MAG: tetratricopeptide repeat protein [Verrucomicrobia bacterium]|nr:tetratricopeptide repeat protein [Verrucomicrobiota bacterium]